MIEKNDILYLFIVIIISAILASAWAGMNHEPVPLQVQENRFPVVTFTPSAAPAPAMPTYDPQLVPGSYADTHPNSTANGDFSPAPVPVIVTTAPLPTITEVPTTAVSAQVTTTCCNNAWNSTLTSTTKSIGSAFNILGISLFMIGMAFVVSIFGRMFRMSPVAVFNDHLNRIQRRALGESASADLIMAGIISIIVGGVILMIGMAIIPAITAATPAMAGCVPC